MDGKASRGEFIIGTRALREATAGARIASQLERERRFSQASDVPASTLDSRPVMHSLFDLGYVDL